MDYVKLILTFFNNLFAIIMPWIKKKKETDNSFEEFLKEEQGENNAAKLHTEKEKLKEELPDE